LAESLAESTVPACANGRQVKREVLSQIDWDNPQFSYRFKLVAFGDASRAFSACEDRTVVFTYERAFQDEACNYKRGIDKIRGHILKFMNLMHTRQTPCPFSPAPPAPACGGLGGWGDICSVKSETKRRVDSKKVEKWGIGRNLSELRKIEEKCCGP